MILELLSIVAAAGIGGTGAVLAFEAWDKREEALAQRRWVESRLKRFGSYILPYERTQDAKVRLAWLEDQANAERETHATVVKFFTTPVDVAIQQLDAAPLGIEPANEETTQPNWNF
jgi:hypothetical protein